MLHELDLRSLSHISKVCHLHIRLDKALHEVYFTGLARTVLDQEDSTAPLFHIHRWRQEGHGLREIARRLGRAASSISRELSRNTGGRGYRPKQAHEQAQRRALPPRARLSLTLDNGKEFARHEEIASVAGIDVFFTRPYHSWERGTNENTNGLIRRLHPKQSSFADIGEEELKRIEMFLNDRPRKCLGWMTPREKMAAFPGYAP